MVLFHDAFVALKARCPLTIACSPDDFALGGEKKWFQEYFYKSLLVHLPRLTDFHRRITDDSFNHVLSVYQDRSSHGLRLHATVRDGELKRTPVWTAFGIITIPPCPLASTEVP
jgi:hypothetical protein